jgi:DNA-binding response OmpR family regulator
LKVLVADDDLELAEVIGFALRQAGYAVLSAPDGPSAIEIFHAERPDLVILDVNMPRLSGFEVLRRLRAETAVPIMMLTVRSSEEDQVRGLDLGADDYLTKPFSPRTLLARVRALLRRGGAERPGNLAAGDLVLDPGSQSVRVAGGEPVRLTALEARLLQLFLTNPGVTLLTASLGRQVWGLRATGDRTLLKQLVHRLRRKVETDATAPERIVTVPGVGYRLEAAR